MRQCPLIGVTYSSDELDDFLLWRLMFQGLVAGGGTPLAIDCAAPQPGIAALVSRLDGLVLSGGGDVDPTLYRGTAEDAEIRGVNRCRDDAEITALESARALRLPVLAICRGAQFVNVALGGGLYQHLARDAGTGTAHERSSQALDRLAHGVEVFAGSLLSKWMGGDGIVQVNSQHHQGICRLADGLTVSATAPDGLVEGFELPDERIVGVQWHPEVLWPTHDHAKALMENFVAECASTARSWP